MSAFERAVDQAIAAENRRWLDQPQSERDAQLEQHHRQYVGCAFLWAVIPHAMAERRDALLERMGL